MRMLCLLCFLPFFSLPELASAQVTVKPNNSQESLVKSKNRRIREMLAKSIRPEDFLKGKEKFKDAVDVFSTNLMKKTPVLVDELGFFNSTGGGEGSPYDQEVSLVPRAGKVVLADAFREVLTQIGKARQGGGAMLVRAGRIDIVPAESLTTENLLKQRVDIEFKDRPLASAIDDLSELTGLSIIVDPRTKEKAHSPITARFNGDVTLKDALIILTELSDLKPVFLQTGAFVTLPERAMIMERELLGNKNSSKHPQ